MIKGWLVTVWRLFVADKALAGFVVCWAVLFWITGRHLGGPWPAAILAVAPMVALWWSVRRAAHTLRRRLEE
jgi:hypothetical protein